MYYFIFKAGDVVGPAPGAPAPLFITSVTSAVSSISIILLFYYFIIL